MPIFKITLTGEVPSKKNRYRIAGRTMYQDPAVDVWADDVYYQVRSQLYKGGSWETVEYPIGLSVDFYITRDKDIDNMLNSIFDALQSCGVIKNDAQIGYVAAAKYIRKKEAPRVEISAKRLVAML